MRASTGRSLPVAFSGSGADCTGSAGLPKRRRHESRHATKASERKFQVHEQEGKWPGGRPPARLWIRRFSPERRTCGEVKRAMFRHGEAPWHRCLAASRRATAVSSTSPWLAVKPGACLSSPQRRGTRRFHAKTQRNNAKTQRKRIRWTFLSKCCVARHSPLVTLLPSLRLGVLFASLREIFECRVIAANPRMPLA